jgi:predicted 3-demethylubiquinone-9 3-methyltransferase (glyoxalase superfamily)
MQKITPFLWFDNNAEEAVQFYTSIFKNSRQRLMAGNRAANRNELVTSAFA